MSSEVGSGHVSIFPIMPGFKGKVSKETRAAGVAGAKTFDGGFKSAGVTAGRNLGKNLKSALATSAGDLAAGQLRKLNSEVAAATRTLSSARLKQQDEAGKVRVAEVKLQEAIAKSGAESSQAVAAEERLAAARRRQASAADTVTAASARLASAQESVAAVTASMDAVSGRAGSGLGRVASNLRAGWKSASDARSAFTGVAGSLGGVARAVLDLTQLPSLSRLVSGQVSKQFTSMATMVRGGVAKAVSASRGFLSSVGTTARGAFGPALSYVQSAGTLMASPFIRLGSQVSGWLSPVTTHVRGLFSKLGAAARPAASRLVSSFGTGLAGLPGRAASVLSSVVSAASNAGAAAGRALGSGLQSAATGAATVAATAIGVALGKGFGRLTAIDTAQAKLRGFGKDAGEIKAIMADAGASVKGTSFGLGEAATVAGAAVAAGIKPGEQLQAHLKSIANNASAAGLSMQDMGSIFNKAATQANGVQNDVIGQLADKGIPIYEELGKQLGVTAGEVFNLASQGKVDFETFSRAATAAAGTVADEMGKTVPGATKNFFAAMGRIGANALGGVEEGSFYNKLGPLIGSVSKALGPLETKAEALGQAWNSWVGPIMDRLTGFFTGIADGSSTVVSKLKEFAPVLAPLTGAFAALGAGGLAGLLGKLGPLGAMLPGLGKGLSLLGGPLGIAAAAFGAFALSGGDVSGLVAGVTGIVDQIVAALPGVIDAVVGAVPGIVDGLLGALPQLIDAAIGIVDALVQGLVASAPLLIDGALALIDGLVDAVVSNLPALIGAAINLVMALVRGIVDAVPLLVEGAIALITGLLGAIVDMLPTIIQGGVQLLMALIQGIVQMLPTLLQAALDLVMGLLGAIIDNLPMIIDAGIQLLLALITGLIDALPQLITAAIELVLQLVAGLLQMLPELIEAGIQLVVSLITGLIEAIPQIIEMLPQIIEAIWNGLADVDWLGLGAQIIQGIIDGFFSMVGSVGDAIGDVLGGILDFFPHSPAKKGPLSASGWRQLHSSGAATMEQFTDGAAGESGNFGDALVGMASSASRRAQAAMQTVSATVAASSTGTATTAGAAAAGAGITMTNYLAHMPPDEAVEVIGQRLTSAARRARA